MDIEDGRDILWIKQLIENSSESRDGLNDKFEVDLESMCQMEDGSPATGISIEQCLLKEKDGSKYCWGNPVKLRFNPFGF